MVKLFRLSSGQRANNRYKQGVSKKKTSENNDNGRQKRTETNVAIGRMVDTYSGQTIKCFYRVCKKANICDCSIKCNNVRMQERMHSKS